MSLSQVVVALLCRHYFALSGYSHRGTGHNQLSNGHANKPGRLDCQGNTIIIFQLQHIPYAMIYGIHEIIMHHRHSMFRMLFMSGFFFVSLVSHFGIFGGVVGTT